MGCFSKEKVTEKNTEIATRVIARTCMSHYELIAHTCDNPCAI